MDDGQARRTDEQQQETQAAKPAASVYDLDEWRRRRRASGRRGRRRSAAAERRHGYADYFGYGYAGYYGSYYGGYWGRYYGGPRRPPGYDGIAGARRDEASAAYRRTEALTAPGRHRPGGWQPRRSVVTLLPSVREQMRRRRRALVLALVACLMIGVLLLGRTVLAREWGPAADPPDTPSLRLAAVAEPPPPAPATGWFFPHDEARGGPQ